MHVLSLLQNKFGLVFFRLSDGALETSNFRFEELGSAITLLRCFLLENTQRGKIARVNFAEQLGTMSKNRLTSLYRVSGQQTCPLYIIISDFVVWGRTSACKGAPGCRYQSIFDLTHPTHTLAKDSHNTGNFMPYSFRIVCGFFNVPHWTN